MFIRDCLKNMCVQNMSVPVRNLSWLEERLELAPSGFTLVAFLQTHALLWVGALHLLSACLLK